MSDMAGLQCAAQQFVERQNTSPDYYSFEVGPTGEVYVSGLEEHEELTRWIGGVAFAKGVDTNFIEIHQLSSLIQHAVDGELR